MFSRLGALSTQIEANSDVSIQNNNPESEDVSNYPQIKTISLFRAALKIMSSFRAMLIRPRPKKRYYLF